MSEAETAAGPDAAAGHEVRSVRKAGLRRCVDAVLRSSIGRDVGIGFLLLLLVGFATLLVADHVFERQSGFVSLANNAGRLRMLSQRIALVARDALGDARAAGAARLELAQLLERFDASFEELRRSSAAMGIFAHEHSSDGPDLGVLERQWQAYRSAAVLIATQPANAPEVRQASAYIDAQAQVLLATADANVLHIVEHSSADRAWLRALMYIMLVIGAALLVVAYVYLRRRLLHPFATISAMAERLAEGHLGARADYRSSDEVGQLVTRLNLTADAMQDLFARRTQAERVLGESETRNRLILDTSYDAIVVTDASGVINFANQSVAAVFGYRPGELLGREVFCLYPQRYRAGHRAGMLDFIKSGSQDGSWRSMEIWVLHQSGKEIRVDLSVNHLRVGCGDLFTGFFRDLSARNAVLADLHLRNRAIESTGEGVMITDALAPGHPITYVNQAFARITGYAQDEVIGRSGRMFLGSELSQPDVDTLRQILRESKEGSVTLHCVRKDGSRFWNELSAAPVRDDRGHVTHYISVFKDVTERLMQVEEKLRWTHHDVLTGLPNRMLFQDRLQQAIGAAGRRELNVGVLFIDLDGFKVVNETLGHKVGDSLLREVAQRLQGCVRDGDTVARLGSDEFVMLLNEVEGDYGIDPVAARTLAALGKAFELCGQEVFIGASIGSSVFPRDGTEGEALVRNADLAMNRAKQHGRNNVQAFSEEMHSQRERWVTIESKLRRAVDRGDFLLHYQPQLSLGNGQTIGAEALVRWQDKDMGLVAPGQFIALAEETGLIGAIGEWVLNNSCAQIMSWRRQGLQAPRIAINISARQFRQANLYRQIEQSLANHGLQASCLEVELTESMVMQDPERTIAILREMREAGLHLSLDDFGTGYSSLSYLRRFPLDVLKVDQSFVREVTANEEAAAIAGAIITLAHSLNLGVVAEGVETAAQLDFLIAQGCDIVQGYYFSKPLPPDEFAAFLQQRMQPCEPDLQRF